MKLFCGLLFFILVQTGGLYGQKCRCSETAEQDKKDPARLLRSAEKNCRALGHELTAKEFLQTKDLDSALYHVAIAEKLYRESACGEKQLLQTDKIYSSIYFFKAEYQYALDYGLKVQARAHALGDHYEEADVLINISQIFARMGQGEKGLSYCRQALPAIQRMPGDMAKTDLLNKTGARYYYYYQDIGTRSLLDTAALFFREALDLAKRIRYSKGIVVSYSKMNSIAYSNKNYSLALLLLDSAIAVARRDGVTGVMATIFGDKGNILLKQGKFTEAARWADSCLYYHQLNKFPPLIANAYSLVAEIADSSGDYQKAYAALYSEKKITDSLNTAEKAKAVNEVEKKYHQAKNEKTIRELAQQKKIYLLFGIAGLMAAIIIGFLFRQQSLRNRQKILETEQRLNRARMNPHFFFNALTAMQRVAMKENDGVALASSLSKFSNIMRETLESTYKEYVTIRQEIEFLKEYMDIQKMRFPNKFTYALMVDAEIDPADILIPSMIIQPFIENTIEHGFSGIEYTGEIRVDFKREENTISIEIKDNGRGIAEPGAKTSGHISRASQIIRDRIYLLNIKLKTKAAFSIDNNKEAAGVLVKIHLPIIYNNENTAG